MKIALTTYPFFQVSGGVVSDTLNLAKAFYELGQEVTIFTPDFSKHFSEHNIGNVKIVSIPSVSSLSSKAGYLFNNLSLSGLVKASAQTSFYKDLSKILRENNYDIVHARNVWCQLLEPDLQKRLKKVLVFGTLPIRNERLIRKCLLRRFYSGVDYKVAVWPSLPKPLFELRGISTDAIIENGVDTNLFSPIQKLKEDVFTIGTAAHFIYPRKVEGLTILFRAISRLFKEGRKFRFKLIGDGPLRPYVEKYLSELNLLYSDNFQFIGNVNYSRMPEFYQSLDLYVHISFQDSGPNTIIEAMSCGIPVMANEVGVVSNVVNKKTGWIVEPTVDGVYGCLSTILEYQENNTLIHMGNEARQLIQQKFSWKKSAMKYLDLYQGLEPSEQAFPAFS